MIDDKPVQEIGEDRDAYLDRLFLWTVEQAYHDGEPWAIKYFQDLEEGVL